MRLAPVAYTGAADLRQAFEMAQRLRPALLRRDLRRATASCSLLKQQRREFMQVAPPAQPFMGG